MSLKELDLDRICLRFYPDPVLRRPARALQAEEIDGDLGALAERMTDLMIASSGIGLAAPQVGVPLRLIVISVTGKADNAFALVNPELTNFQGTSEVEEGCLSVPGVRGKVRRAQACTVHAFDLEGQPVVMDAADLSATVLQHEIDHLEGTLFIDRLSTIARLACRKTLKALEDDYARKRRR